MTTHHVVADSIHISKLGNGAYKQVRIKRPASGTYHFHYADLDGSNVNDKSISKDNFNSNFGYFSLQNNTSVNSAPAHSNWQLMFTQYTAFLPMPYPVTGVLQNAGVEAVKAYPVAEPKTFEVGCKILRFFLIKYFTPL